MATFYCRMILFFESPDESPFYGLFLVFALTSASVLKSVCLNQYWNRGNHCGLRVRGALISQVYQKGFRLTSKARQESTVGEIINLESVDACVVEEMFPYIHLCKN